MIIAPKDGIFIWYTIRVTNGWFTLLTLHKFIRIKFYSHNYFLYLVWAPIFGTSFELSVSLADLSLLDSVKVVLVAFSFTGLFFCSITLSSSLLITDLFCITISIIIRISDSIYAFALFLFSLKKMKTF